MTSLASGGQLLGFEANAQATTALGYAKGELPTKAPPAAVAPGPDITMWSHAFGAWGAWDGDGNAARLSRDLAGVIAGIDTRFADVWRGGVAGGYSQSDVRVPARASSADIESYHVAAYLGARYGAWGLRGGASYAWHDIDTVRSIVFPGFGEIATASYDASTAQVFGEIGYGMTFGRTALEPFAGLAWVNVDMGSFAETGGLAALVGAGDSRDVGYSTVGVRAASSIPWANGTVLVPRVSAAWQHAFGDVTPEALLAFQSTGAAFTVAGVPIARDSALIEASLDLVVNHNATLGISYVGQLAEEAQDHGVKAKALWRF